MKKTSKWLGSGGVLAFFLGACAQAGEPQSRGPVGQVAGSGAGGSVSVQLPEPSAACANAADDAGVSPWRRLTRFEYDASIRSLFPGVEAPSQAFLPDAQVGAFPSNAGVAVLETQLDKYLVAAEDIASKVKAAPAVLGGCAAAGVLDEACARQLIIDVGRRAYRRPLAQDEVDGLLALYRAGAEGATGLDGLELVITAILQSPHFLYHVEQPAGMGVAALTDHELADRLAFFLTGAPADAELGQLADTGQLTSQLGAQARRLLQAPAARDVFGRMVQLWLGVERADTVVKDTVVFPEFGPELAVAMRQEVSAFASHVLFDADHSLRTLLTASVSVDSRLASLYGLTGSPTTPAPVEHRAGILTLPAVLAVYATHDQTSPIRRGKFVRNRLLCQDLPMPPADVDVTLPKVDPSSSTRQRFAAHRADPTCAGCHQLMDPLGFGFEAFDALGRFRTVDGPLPIDDSGELAGEPAAIAGPFRGASELAEKLASSAEAQACVARQWSTFAFSRALGARDSCWLERVAGTLTATGDLQALILAIAEGPAFKQRRGE